MNLYINGRFLTQAITGVQRYAVELVKQWDGLLASGDGETAEYRFTLLVPPGAIHDLNLKRIRVKQVGRIGGHAWEQLVLPWHARDGWLVNLCNTGPLSKRRQIATIHDAAVYEFPHSFSFAFRSAYRVIQNGLGIMAQRIITVSQFSKTQLTRHCRIPESKIRVVALGNEHVRELRADPGIFAKHGIEPKRYLLAVSSHNPSKNFANLVKAVECLENADYDIVIAGGANAKIFGRSDLPVSGKIKQIGYVTDGELKALYEGAACFVFPSLYEGFGLPPLEAMACGTPVVVSDAASLPEVCGEAALYCDPRDPRNIARQIGTVMSDERIRETLSESGRRQAARFTWGACARQTLEVVKEAIRA
ncbi:glycosyltransferase family 4 protein [Cohnella candidum]|uniref:Glycosyltransferase family 1 protein n=1 Tax=Cohnella candidum TaxID=2674991 RepID=A0A3G3K012_9BACL|nr:glycosyltransferase family 1 protein [Cohnella candidum]AYQ73844.1 glycosyltransferase family 1 protein [Cohnella candidum]